MKTRTLHYLPLIAGVLLSALLSGCGSKGSKSTAETDPGTPPSLQQSDAPKLTMVQLTQEQQAELKIPLQKVEAQVKNYILTAPATVFPAPNHIGIVSAPVDGRITSMPVQEGQKVGKGQVILEIESLTYGSLVADYLQAHAEVELQASQLSRMEKLAEKKISAEMDLEKAKADYTRASAALNAGYARLKTLGVSDSEIDGLQPESRINPRLKIHSPIGGVVDSHSVELGQAVTANEKLATIISLDKVLIKAYLAPEDGMLVTPGDTVRISHRLMIETPLVAIVTTINPGLDENNRSVVVNIMLNVKGSVLKPGDNVRTEIYTRTPAEIITVSMDAVTYDNNDPVVFVSHDPSNFEMRRIRIREIVNGFAVVTSGLKPGEQVAVGQVFSLKALSRYKLISEE